MVEKPHKKDARFIPSSIRYCSLHHVYVTTPVCVGSTIVELDDNSNTFTESGTLQSNPIVMVENIEREPLLFMDSYAADYGMHSVVSTSWDKGSENNKANVTTTSSRS